MTSKILRDSDGKPSAYAWPGGYPVMHYLADGAILCAGCAGGESGSEASEDADTDAQWRLVGSGVHWEGEPELCSHCGSAIPSAYGVPDDACESRAQVRGEG